MLLRIILQKKGHIVTEAEDGVEALELMQHGDFDLVFLDMQMPRLGGLEVARAFESHGRKAPMLVALSAQAQPEDQKAAKEVGISAYITKPLQEEQLDKVIRIVSDRKVAGL
jgi:CheY-like chemotaxis protein